MKAVRGEEEEEEEEEAEALGGGTAPQKPDFSDLFSAPAGDGIPAKNHDDDEEEERVSGTAAFCLYIECNSLTSNKCGGRREEGGGRRGEFGAAGCHREERVCGLQFEWPKFYYYLHYILIVENENQFYQERKFKKESCFPF